MAKARRLTSLDIDSKGRITNVRGREIDPSSVRPIGEPRTITLGESPSVSNVPWALRMLSTQGSLPERVNAYVASSPRVSERQGATRTYHSLVQLYELNEKRK